VAQKSSGIVLYFQHTTNSEPEGASEIDLKAVESGGHGWICIRDPLPCEGYNQVKVLMSNPIGDA